MKFFQLYHLFSSGAILRVYTSCIRDEGVVVHVLQCLRESVRIRLGLHGRVYLDVILVLCMHVFHILLKFLTISVY